jgi:hypothetical protein
MSNRENRDLRDTLSTNDDLRDAKDRGRDTNPDAITGAPGSHPVGTGIGAAAAGAAGAAIGSVIPGAGTAVGGVIGAVVGAVAGGYAGKAAAEAIDPTAEMDYWRENHKSRPYYNESYSFEDDYAPAYRFGYESRSRYQNQNRSELDDDLRSEWESTRGQSKLDWNQASMAVDDSWARYDEAMRRREGDSSLRSDTGSGASMTGNQSSGTSPDIRSGPNSQAGGGI